MNNARFKEFAKYTSFNVAAMLGVSVYILADTFFIALDMGAYGLAALNFSIPIYGLMFGIGFMLGIGGATRHTILSGRGDKEGAQNFFCTTLVLGAGLSAALIVGGVFFAEDIGRMFGAEGLVLVMTAEYLRVVMIFAPAYLLLYILVCFARNSGAPGLAMVATAGNSMLNILLDWVMISILGWGMFGAALATGVSHSIGVIVISRHFIKNSKFSLKLNLRQWRATALSNTKGILATGIPTFVANTSIGVTVAVFNVIIFGFAGNIGVAAYSVIVNILFVVVSIFDGIAQGIQPLISHYYSIRDGQASRTILRYALITMVLISSVIYSSIFFGAEAIVEVFNSEGDGLFQSLAITGIRVYFSGIVMAGFNIIMAIYFTSVDNPRPAQVISVLRGLVIMIPLALLLSHILGLLGVWLTFPAAEFIVAGVAIFFFSEMQASAKNQA